MREKGHLNHSQILLEPDENVISSQRGSITRDRYDVMTCDIFLANLLNAEKISVGTMVEYRWADAYRKPIITVIEKQNNIHDHAFIRELTGFRVETLEEGLQVVSALLRS